MTFLIGAVIITALVHLLLLVVPGASGTVRSWRLPAHMLMLAVSSLAIPTDLLAIAALASSATAVFELTMLIG